MEAQTQTLGPVHLGPIDQTFFYLSSCLYLIDLFYGFIGKKS